MEFQKNRGKINILRFFLAYIPKKQYLCAQIVYFWRCQRFGLWFELRNFV